MQLVYSRRLLDVRLLMILGLCSPSLGLAEPSETAHTAPDGLHSAHGGPANAVDSKTRERDATPRPPIAKAVDVWQRDRLTGDWGGQRTQLEDDGLTLRGFHVAEYAQALSGGASDGEGSAWAQQLGLGADFDMGKLAGWSGALFHLGLNIRVGHNLSGERLGNRLAVQEVYGAGETIRPTEISYEQRFFDDRVNTLIGFYPMGNEFASTPLLCVFQNVGFCAHPQNLPASSGWSDYPTGKWGGRVKITPTDSSYAEVGVYNVNPTYYDPNNGFRMDFNGSTGQLIPLELGITLTFGAAQVPGHYKIGGYYDTTNAEDVITGRRHSERYGGYVLADQMLVSFDGTPARGLIGFAQGSISDDDTATFANQLDAGLVAQGPIAARPNDFIALGWVRAGLNDRITDARRASGQPSNLSSGENVYEFGYGVKLMPSVLLHPNIQYIDNPGAFANQRIDNAWVFGFQTKVTL